MRLLLLVPILFVSLTSVAQENEEQPKSSERTLSNAEQYFTESGKILEKQFHFLGKVRGLEVQMLQIIDHAERSEIRALRFELNTSTQYATKFRVGIIDKDELESLLKAMRLVKEKVLPTTRNAYTEVTYKSRGGFEVGCYFDPKKVKWQAYVRVDKYYSDAHVSLSAEEFSQLLGFVESAQL